MWERFREDIPAGWRLGFLDIDVRVAGDGRAAGRCTTRMRAQHSRGGDASAFDYVQELEAVT